MDLISKFQIIYDKKQLESKIQDAKTQIEEGLKVNLTFGNSSGSGDFEKTYSNMQTRIDSLNKKIAEQINQRKKLSQAIDAEAVSAKNLAQMESKLSKIQIKNEGFLGGDTSQAKEAQEQITNVQKAIDDYRTSATKVNKLKVSEEFAKLSVPLASAKKNIFSVSEMLGNAAKKFAAFMSVTQVAWMAMRAFKQMFENVKELDSALIELQKVSDLTGDSLNNFVDKVFESANTLGRTGVELINAVTAFKRAGYELNEAFTLGESALLMMNIGDGIENIDTASSVLISTLKAFNLEASDANSVLDVLNEVSNTSAISFADLAEGIRRTGAVYAQADVSIEQLSGLLTGTNEIMQNIEKSSSGLIIVSQRLRGIKDGSEEGSLSVTKLGQDLKDMANVDLVDQEGQLRNTYDVLKDIAGAWGTLTTNQKQYLAEELAGKRQVNVLQSMLTNWEEVERATESATNSLGSANKENERYMNSMEAKLNAISSSFQQLSASMLDSGILKFIMELGKAALDISDKLGGWNVILTAGMAIFGKWGKSLPSQLVRKLTSNIGEMGVALTDATFKSQLFTKGVNTLGTAVNTFKGILATFLPMLIMIVATKFVDFMESTSQSVEESKQKVNDLTDELSNLQSEYDTLSKLTSLTDNDKDKLKILEQQIELQKESIELAKQNAFEAEFEGDVGAWDKLKSNIAQIIPTIQQAWDEGSLEVLGKGSNQWLKESGQAGELIERLVSQTKELSKENKELANSVDDSSKSIEDISEEFNDNATKINENKQELLDYYNTLKEARESIGNSDGQQEYYDNLLSQMKEVIDSGNSLIDSNGEIVSSNEAVADSTDEVETAQSALTTTMESLASETELLSSAWKEQSSDGELSIDTVMKMIEAGSEYINLLEVENGTYKLNEQGALALFETKKQVAMNDILLKKQEVEMQIAATQATINAYKVSGEAASGNSKLTALSTQAMSAATQAAITALGETANATVKATNKAVKAASAVAQKGGMTALYNSLSESKNQLAQYDKSLEVLSNLTLPSYTGTLDKATSSTNNASSATDSLQESVDNLKNSLDSAKDALSNMETAYKAMQTAIVNQLEKEIALQEDKLELIEKQKQIYEAQQDKAQDIIDKEIQAIQDKIDALDEEKDKEDAILKLQEAQLNAQKAQDAYEQAKSNRNTRVYSESVGWTWQADPSAVEDAKKEMEDALKDLNDIQKEQELDQKKYDFEQQIAELEKLKDAWGQNMDDIYDEIKNHEDVLSFAEQFEKATLEERKKLLEEFTKNYGKNVVDQNKSTNDTINKLKDLKEQWKSSMDIDDDISKYAGAQAWLKKFENATYEERKVMLENFTASWKSYYNQQTASINNLQAALDAEQKKLDSVKNSANGASGAMNNYSKSVDTANSKTLHTIVTENGVVYAIGWKNGVQVSKQRLGSSYTSTNGNITVQGANGSISKFATGGVDDFGTNGIVNYTGTMPTSHGDVQVDGGTIPEVILNSKQQANILFQLANNPSRVKSDSVTNNNSSPIIIQSLNIQANESDTLDRLLTQAQQMVRNR